jgi:molybdopterin synthase sulfur carrier subunit
MARTVTLLYFAAIRDAVGLAEEELELPDAVATVSELSTFLEGVRPALAGRLSSIRFAVNEVFASGETGLAPGDVVALIPPVSGG